MWVASSTNWKVSGNPEKIWFQETWNCCAVKFLSGIRSWFPNEHQQQYSLLKIIMTSPAKCFLKREYMLLRVIIWFQCKLSLPDFLSLDFLRHSRSDTIRIRGGVLLLKPYNSLPVTAKSYKFRKNCSNAFWGEIKGLFLIFQSKIETITAQYTEITWDSLWEVSTRNWVSLLPSRHF